MRCFLIMLSLLGLVACEGNSYRVQSIALVPLKTFPLEGISVRAMTLIGDNVGFAGSDTTYGLIFTQNQTMYFSNLKNVGVISDFRAIDNTTSKVFMLSIGNPALIYKTEANAMKEVYRESHERVFYDGLRFLDDRVGIAVGDPVEEGRMSVVITNNGGESWIKKPTSQSPKLAKGEVLFAASNSSIAVQGSKIWVVTGGAKSHVFFSEDKGVNWHSSVLPLQQGSASQGAFSIDFFDKKHGIVVGGDYQHPAERKGTVAITADGGKTWQRVPESQSIGYASCVKYIPQAKGYGVVAASPNGIFFSNNGGFSWQKVSDKVCHALLFADERTLVASGDGEITLFRVTEKR